MKTTETPIEQKPAHTPGPWHTGGEWPQFVAIYDANCLYIAHANTGMGSTDFAERGVAIPGTNEARANARLIAAAPELLEALEGVLLAIHETDAGRCAYLKAGTGRDYNEHMEAARLAIAKAKGHQ